MNSSTSNAEQAVSFDFLVKVVGDKLELQHDILQSLLVPYTNNEVPVAIVSVIGQPKSRKTLLTNYIQNGIIRMVDTERKQFGTAVTPLSGFPRSLDDCPSKSVRDKLDGQEGVLIWTKPCLVQPRDGHSLAVFILDIWSENPSPSLYTRLVDFCITSSSIVILVEDCCVSKESNWSQWNVSKSLLAQLKAWEFQNLHVLIHANWEEENFHTLGLEGGEYFMNASKDQFTERLSRVIDNGHILKGYFKDASFFLAQLKSKSTVQIDKINRSDKGYIGGLLEFSCKVVGTDPSKLFPLARNKTILSTLSVESLILNGIVISNSVAAITEATDATTLWPNNISVSHSSVLRGNVDDTGEEAMDQTEPSGKPLKTSKVPLFELKHGENLVGAYLLELRTFVDNSSETELFFKDEDLKTLHLRWKSHICEDFLSEFPSLQADEFLETMNTEFEKIVTDFKQENSENRRLYYLHLQEGEKNSKLKFDQIIAKLRIQVLQNPLEPLYNLRNDDLDCYYVGFTENLPGKLKNYFTSWYSCKSDQFKADLGFMEAMMKDYKKKMQMVLISSRCKNVTRKKVEEDNVLYSKNAEEMASNHKWSHKPLNDIAKEAIVLTKETFSVCIDVTYRILEAHKIGLQVFVDSHSNNDSLYFEDDELNSVHSKLKTEIEQSDVISRIPPALVDDLLAKMKTDCDEIFSDFVTKYCDERTSFYDFYEQVKLNTKRKFDEEVAKLELQIRKDPSNLLYDLKKANLNNYVKILTQNVSDRKWKNYFISWYSHELDEFRKDVHAMISAIQLYRDKWKTFFNENVCVNENKFHESHSILAKFAEGDNNHKWKNNSLKVLSRTGIELTKQSFNQLNLDLINKEEEMAKQASVYAEERYNVLMKSKISERTFTDSEVKTLHQMCVKAVVDSFHAVPQFKYTYVWQHYLIELGNRLHIHLSNYLKENQQHVDRVQRTKKNVLSDCSKFYNDSMNKLIADRVISDKILRSHHDQSFEEVLQILNVRMNSITEKFDKSSWAKELAEKLRIYCSAFAEENNNKIQNEAENYQPATAALIDYANARSTQSCGVGIYFGPDIVRLGIYLNAQTKPKYLNFSPCVTFEGNEIVFFNQHSSHWAHFDVYKTLVEEKNFPRTVFVSGKSYQLCTEEIVAVFLNKIKSEAETKFGFVITSCTVAVSAFMSTSSKHMLKTALTLAGFERSTIIQSTTAVGLSYVVTNKVYGNVPAAFIHQAGSVFDVAIALISQTSICIRRISGLPYLEKSSNWNPLKLLSTTDSQDVLSKKLKKLVSSTLASSDVSAWQLEAVVMVQGEKNFTSDASVVTEPLLCRSLNTLDEAQGIVLGAAVFNAVQNKIPGAPNLEYNEVFPYTVIADIIGEQIIKIVKHNVAMPVTIENRSINLPFTDVWSSRKVRIAEFAVEKENILVGEYTVNAVHSSRNFFVVVNFNYEGLIEVEAKTSVNSRSIPVQIRTKGLTMAQQCSADENLRPILIPATVPCLSSVPVKRQELKTNTGAIGNEMTPPVFVVQDSKTKLVDSITEVTDRLAKSTATNSIVVTRTNMLMKQFKELLGKDDVEEKLQVYLNALSEENNGLLNEARNHQPEAAASADYGNVTSTQSFGVGIYLGPDIVRLGIYLNAQTNPNYLEFSPFVTFERNEIVFFNRHGSHHLHFDVYKTLVEEENFPRTVLISDKVYQLHTEEIVALFLNKIKSEAETKFGFVITSCTVAVSAFMSTSSKQMLKTALTLAGFERSTIIHSTTAVGLSFVVTSKVCPNSPAIFVHQAGSVFDVAIAIISQTSISVRNISGLPYLEKSSGHMSAFLDTTNSQDALSKKVKILINNTLASSEFTAWQLEALVMVQGEKHFLSDKSAITEPLLGRPLTTLDEAEGIVLGAAAFNARENKIPGAPNLEYNEVFPYTFIADINGKQTAKIVRHNVLVISKNMSTQLSVTDVRDFGEVRITEFAVENQKIIVGEYTINAMNSKCENFLLRVKFNSEGLIEVEAQTADLKRFPVQIRTQGLTAAELCTAVENLRSILIPTASP